MYTTHNKAPLVKPNERLRGFFRVGAWKEERAIIEFGFPGPRIKRYNIKDWQLLRSCIFSDKTNDITVSPRTVEQVRLVQELVELGYLVNDVENNENT
jgi:hypothetical protein